jgi:ribosomal protein S18 acetylase RimI-like enzyme
MAPADPAVRDPEIIELRRLGAGALNPMLDEENREWNRNLAWDFSKSADLVRKFADERALEGSALMEGREVAGYGYTVLEDGKGVIGDLYVRPPWRAGGAWEARLFRLLLESLIATGVRRIESQLMLPDASVAKAIQRERFVRIFERRLMVRDATLAMPPNAGFAATQFHFERWGEHYRDPAANLIALSYQTHVDGQINDQYRTFTGARNFLNNIVQYPGCGAFSQPASFVAFDVRTGWLSGCVLTSFVAREVGHITQICVAPHAQGRGLGSEMLVRASAALRAAGAKMISLTVTSANEDAIRLYARCGFVDVRRFFAFVWESF